MNNKRFVLTTNEDGLTQLWQADTAECVKSFGSKKFQDVKESNFKLYDLKHSQESPLPKTWM